MTVELVHKCIQQLHLLALHISSFVTANLWGWGGGGGGGGRVFRDLLLIYFQALAQNRHKLYITIYIHLHEI